MDHDHDHEDITSIDVENLYIEHELRDFFTTSSNNSTATTASMADLIGRKKGGRRHPRTTTQAMNAVVYVNSRLSSRQMESLTAICDTFLPSITFDLMNTPNTFFYGRDHDHESLSNFYETSASMAGTPERIGGFLSERFKHPALGILMVSLWMLSTWFGTFILCGWVSLSPEFPYFQRFSQLSLNKKEKVLTAWSKSYIYLLKMLFISLKYFTLLTFFTQLDEKNDNQSWKALGYSGPDPEFAIQIDKIQTKTRAHQGDENKNNENNEEEEKLMFGPLQRGLIDPRNPKQAFIATLRMSGFPVSTHYHQNERTKGSSLSSPSLTINCDVVVVGSGSGGGVVAGVLAKAGYKVIVLEKGDYFARSNLSLLEGPTMDQMYQGSGMLTTKDLSVAILAGSTVGGGSTINWSASIRTPQNVINEWSNRYELELFESKLYKEAIEAVWGRMGVQCCVHEEGLNNAVLRRGCLELGYPVNNIPRNAPSDHNCGWCGLGCKDGRKKGTAETWLVDMVDSGNGLILPGCQVKKVLHERKNGRNRDTATGVVFQFDDGHQKEIYRVKSKVTVVAGGALCTPVLLKRSGLKNPNIGKHLHLHPVTMAWGYFGEEEKKSYEGAIMTAMSTVVADFQGTGYGAVIQTPALHPGLFSALTPWVSGFDMKERMSKFSRTAHIFALARDEGSGKVKSTTSLEYKIDKRDEVKLKRGMEKLLRILAAAGAEEIGTQHIEGRRLKVKEVSSHEFERFVKEESEKEVSGLVRPVCSAHQMGSCRMGIEPKGSAVNQTGETWEVEGLFVADSSVLPTALGVNPMVTIQAIAYCTAQSVLEVLGRKKKGI